MSANGSTKVHLVHLTSYKIRFIGIEIIKNGTQIGMQVYRKPINTGFLLHFQNHMVHMPYFLQLKLSMKNVIDNAPSTSYNIL